VSDLWAALCLVLVIEGLLLFVAPATWKQAVSRLLEQPDRALRVAGGVMMAAGLAALWWVRA
jgi:uncharacterized protein YjeT (DUF2065 family)